MAITGKELANWRKLKPPIRALIIALALGAAIQAAFGVRLLLHSPTEPMHALVVLPSALILTWGTQKAFTQYRLMVKHFEHS